MRLAEIDREAVNLGGCEWGGGLAHSSLRDEGTGHKSLSEKCLSWPSLATLIIPRFGEYSV